MRTPPLTPHWWVAHPATRELGNTVFDSRGRYTQHKRQACHSGGREGGAQWGGQPALPAPPAPGPLTPTHCLCGPQHKTSVNTRLLPALNRLTWRPGSPPQPSWPTTPRPLQKHEARPRLQPAPRSGCFPAGNVLSTEPARGAETPQGSAPPSFVLSQNELVPCVLRFPARVRRAGHWGRKAICARRRGGFHLRASLPLTQAALWGAGVPPFPARCPPAQVPGPRSAGLWPSTPQQGGDGPGRRDPGACAERAVARGSVTCCSPPPTHNTHPEEEARGCGWAGGEGIFLLREPSAHTPHPGDRTGRGRRRQRLRRRGEGGRLAHLLKSSAFFPRAGSRGNGEGLLAEEQRGWICISEGGRKAGSWEGT